MALQLDLSLPNNFGETSHFPSAYIKVDRVECSKAAGRAAVLICKERDGRVLDVRAAEFPVALDGGNFISQAYAHLKTLPEFAGATDC